MSRLRYEKLKGLTPLSFWFSPGPMDSFKHQDRIAIDTGITLIFLCEKEPYLNNMHGEVPQELIFEEVNP